MHRRGRSLRAAFLLIPTTAVVLILYSYSNSTLRVFTPIATIQHSRDGDNGPFPPAYSFTIKLLAYNRPESLSRCLRSLARADYGGDRVNLHVYIDHFPIPTTDASADNSDLVDRQLAGARQILDFVDGFAWPHGQKLLHYRTANAGLQAQWLEAWWPASDDEFAFVVEDDLEVSELYYRFLKGVIGRYYYEPENYSPSVYGASLQRPRFVPGKHGNKLHLDDKTHVFLYQLVGTWGQLLFPKPWKEFRLWYDAHKSKGIRPLLDGMVTTGWYKKIGNKIWTPWFIKFIHSRGYYNIYTNFQHERALSTSHRDAGVNYGKSVGPDSVLIDEKSLDFNIWDMPSVKNLKWYDFCFREVIPGRMASSYDDFGPVLSSLQKEKLLLAFSLYKVPEKITRNLLCHLERLNMQNHIFIGPNTDFLLELSRRGHPVVNGDDLLKTVSNQQSGDGFANRILALAYVLRKCLEHGFNTWMIGGNVVPISNAFYKQSDGGHEFFAAKDTDLFFARSSPSTNRIWTDTVIPKLTADVYGGGHDARDFTKIAADVLKKTNGARLVRDDISSFILPLGGSFVNSTADVTDGKKVLYWNPEIAIDSLKRGLSHFGFWLLDGDSSCNAVICHQS